MDMVIVLEFREWKKVVPIILLLVNEKSEELFQFLINPLRLSVSLRVIRGCGCQLDS